MAGQGGEPSGKRLFKDRTQKRVYSYPEMAESLLRDFVATLLPGGSEWLKRLDFSSLERIHTEQVTKAFSARYADLLWRLKVRRKDGSRQWLHVLLLLEFQSTVDWLMALRVQEYAVEVFFSPDLAGGKVRAGFRLPPLLAVVLYNGKQPWNAPVELAHLVDADAQPVAREDGEEVSERATTRRLFQGERYELIDLQRYSSQDLAAGGLAAQLMRWELIQDRAEAAEVMRAELKLLPRDQHRELRAAFVEIVRHTGQRLGLELDDLVEDETMRAMAAEKRLNSTLEERIQQCDQRLLQEGWAEGLKQGLKQGIEQGIEQERVEAVARNREMVSLLIGRKFGPETQRRAARLLARVIDLAALSRIPLWILECVTGEQLLRRLEDLARGAAA